MTSVPLADIDPKKTILFVGAGVSTILGLPSWQVLIDEIAKQLNYDPRVYGLLGTHLSLAEFYKLERGGVGSLRSWMDVNWHQNHVDVRSSDVHKAIVKAGFRKIYTTNFDRWIERACEAWEVPYKKILNIADLASPDEGLLEVVKFHGDFDDDSTLVLTETSYFDRLDFESPLDQMLRADVLRHPILFIGYSLSDINVRYLFYKLFKIRKSTGASPAKTQSYIFMSNPNPVEESIFRNWGVTPIVEATGNPSIGLLDFLVSISARSTSPSS